MKFFVLGILLIGQGVLAAAVESKPVPPEQLTTVVIDVTVARLRSEPLENAKEVDLLQRGRELVVLQTLGTWFQVATLQEPSLPLGWVDSRAVKNSADLAADDDPGNFVGQPASPAEAVVPLEKPAPVELPKAEVKSVVKADPPAPTKTPNPGALNASAKDDWMKEKYPETRFYLLAAVGYNWLTENLNNTLDDAAFRVFVHAGMPIIPWLNIELIYSYAGFTPGEPTHHAGAGLRFQRPIIGPLEGFVGLNGFYSTVLDDDNFGIGANLGLPVTVYRDYSGNYYGLQLGPVLYYDRTFVDVAGDLENWMVGLMLQFVNTVSN